MSKQHNLVNCPDCGREVSRKADTCPSCGRSFLNSSHGGVIFLYFVGAMVLAFLFIVFKSFS